jgi:CheY-like chemotaxis protein
MEIRPESAETILIVDDDELVRKSAVTLMASLGYRVLSAGSGSEALEVLRQDGAIDLLFTDVFMPGGMHGPQLDERWEEMVTRHRFACASCSPARDSLTCAETLELV